MASQNDATCENDPHFGIICAFFHKFSVFLEVPQPNICVLQSWLENTDEVPAGLRELHIKLLKKCRKKVDNIKWERALVKFCHTYSSEDAWEIESFGYKKSSLKVKLRMLKEMLETQFELNKNFRRALTSLKDVQMRDKPLGRDKLGRAYWLTQDLDCNLRIYQEYLDQDIWQIVASNRDEFVSLISCLKDFSRRRKKIDTKKVIDQDTKEVPVRQSSRIAKLKIREEVERPPLENIRRKLEEIVLKNITEDLKKEKEEEQKSKSPKEATGISTPVEPQSNSETLLTKKFGNKNRSSDSDEGELEYEHESEPASDHKFSPESDIEDDSQAVSTKRARTVKQVYDNNDEANYDDWCQKCGTKDHPEWILLCDKCDKGYHCSCLIPVLFIIPEVGWYCPPCEQDQLIKTLEHHLSLFDKEVRRRERETEIAEHKEAQKAERMDTESNSKTASSSSSGCYADKPTYQLRTRNQVNMKYYESDNFKDSYLELNNNICATVAKPTVSPTNNLQNMTGTEGTPRRKSQRGKNKLSNVTYQKPEDPYFVANKRNRRTSSRTPLSCIVNTMAH